MGHAQRPAPPGQESFDRSCAYCGARFRVRIAHGPFADHAEEYACPECGKRYETGAAHAPLVELVQPRQDGKTDRYQDTLF